MTMMQRLWPKATKRPDSMRSLLMTVVMEILQERKALGATTGYMMTWIERNQPELAKALDRMAPKTSEADRIQCWKTHIGHALDDWEVEHRVHCDEVGKRVMDGDLLSVPVWRTKEDWEALRSHCRWMLRSSHISQPRPYAERQRRLFENQSKRPAKQ